MLPTHSLEADRSRGFRVSRSIHTDFGNGAFSMPEALKFIYFQSLFGLEDILHQMVVHQADLLGHGFIVLLRHFLDEGSVNAILVSLRGDSLDKVPIYA